MIIRRAIEADIPGLQAVGAATIRDNRGVVRAPEEIESVEDYARMARDHFAPTNETHFVWFVAELDGEIAGECNVRRFRPSYVAHVAVLGIGVHPAYQRRGIGRALLCTAIAWARDHGVSRLELYVREDNDRARALYESEGFALEAKRAKFVRLPSGVEIDDCIYVRWL